jgi:predicted dehydrogenase
MHSISRRDFLNDTAFLSAALAGISAGGLWAEEAKTARAKKAGQDVIRVACIGVRGRGRDHVNGFAGKHGCVVTTICDVDEAVIGRAMKGAERGQPKGQAPKYVKDLRKVVEDKNIDVISIATPNHWHALAAIWALQNGKDVYVEKPVSHNVSEGRRIIETARKYNRICQAGTQIRSQKGSQQAIEFLRSGKLGKVLVARGLCYKNRPSIGKVSGPQQPPRTMDYNLWIGPAPYKLPHRNTPLNGTVHYDWHWIWDYGNGDLGNQGIHQMDVARWGLGKEGLCNEAFSLGGRFGYEDDGETPNTQVCVMNYGDAELIFEVRGLPTKPYKGAKVGNVFHCEGGTLVFTSYSSAVALDPQGKQIKNFSGGGDHYGNFIQAVRSRRREEQNGEILEGHLSSALCHLANISYRLGSLAPYDKARKSFGDDKAAGETLERTREHLKDNKVAVDGLQYRVGRRLRLEPGKETFLGDKEANAMLTRQYREGFVVPAKV